MSEVEQDDIVINVSEWEVDALVSCVEAMLEFCHNPGICPREDRNRLVKLRDKLVNVRDNHEDKS